MIFITNTLISYIQAGLASRIKSISELDSAIMLPTVILVVAYFISNMLPNTSSILTNILACIPILSMYILPTAYMLNKVSIIVITISFAVLLITLVIVYKVVSSKFKNNLLDLGKKKLEKEDEEVDTREEFVAEGEDDIVEDSFDDDEAPESVDDIIEGLFGKSGEEEE